MEKKFIKQGISVIIPTFNRDKYLYSTLICLFNQKEVPCNYEIIIVDSGDDETKAVVDLFSKNNVNIHYKKINKCKNRSLIRNEGAKLAQYDILCFLDNDILVPPDFINRHFEEHQKFQRLVLLGCRKGLIDFDINKISEEALQTNFDILEQLPYYTDERIRMYNNNEPWRFVFSHTVSIEKEDFVKAGGFNTEFGEHWGFEDLELGFNLQIIGCTFKLLTDQFTYHQPHFAQSNKEQHEISHNAELFIKLHNCFECELYESFYTSFNEFYPILKNLHNTFQIPSKKLQKEYELIFGCLFSSNENVSYRNMYLGAYSMKESNSCKKLLLDNTFFAFPQIIQMSILSEAFRVSSNVYIERFNSSQIVDFIRIAKDAGLVINYKIIEEKVEFRKTNECASKLFIMLLPDIFEPEKRYVYTWFASHLLQNGVFVNLRDMRKTEKLEYDDFYLSKKERIILEKNFERCFGKTQLQYINSLSMLLIDSSPEIQNSSRSFIFHDEDYAMKFNSLKFRVFNQANHFDESVFICLSFLSVYELCQKYMERKKLEKKQTNSNNDNTFICFMENGYKEDGIDLILEAFSKYTKKNPEAKLTIKTPDYSLFTNVVYTLHNDISKYSKLFSSNQKIDLDIRKLHEKIKKEKLASNITFIQKNLSIEEIVSLIDMNETLILTSRNCSVPPQVYISLLLGKRTIISQHHIILEWLQKLCAITESVSCNFATEFEVPASCMNVSYLAFRTDTEALCNNLVREKSIITDDIKMKIESEAYRIIDTYFVKK